jgi:predicted alpha/beta superfamily hydrolase
MPAEGRRYYLCGYSLAGLFALWGGYQTGVFAGVAGVSPSVWYPGWREYAAAHQVKTGSVYLSLGQKEEKTRNKVMAFVGDAIREQYALLQWRGIESVLEWNPGNHFVDSDVRMAKGLAWLAGRGQVRQPER